MKVGNASLKSFHLASSFTSWVKYELQMDNVGAFRKMLQGISIITLHFYLNDAVANCSKGAFWLLTYWLPWLERLLFFNTPTNFLSWALDLCRIITSMFFMCLYPLWWLHLNLSLEKLTYILNQEGISWFVLFHLPCTKTVCLIWKSLKEIILSKDPNTSFQTTCIWITWETSDKCRVFCF